MDVSSTASFGKVAHPRALPTTPNHTNTRNTRLDTQLRARFPHAGPGTCDRNMCERCCNVATSTPYIACGCHALKHRKTASGKAWGASVVAAGAASMVFHSSYGSFREWGRRLDFW